MNNSNFEILKFRFNSVLYGGLPGLLFFVLIAFGNKLALIQLSCIAVPLVYLMFKVIVQMVHNHRDKMTGQDAKYIDKPLPSTWDFALVILRFAGWYSIVFLITAPVALFLRNVGLTTVFNWHFGLALVFLWGFLYASYSMFTTQYVISERGLLLSSGLNKISMSIQEVQTIERVENILNTVLYDILVSKSPLIVGVRVHDLLLLKRKKENNSSNVYFGRIYITPSNPDEFFEVLSSFL